LSLATVGGIGRAISGGTQADVWIYEWARDTLSRITFGPTDDVKPVWTPDGRRMAFALKRGDKSVSQLRRVAPIKK
jgi:Tol biopolymer transport system component